MARSMSSSSASEGAEPGREPSPYQAIASLLERLQAELPSPSAEESDAAFGRTAELMLKLFAEYAQRYGRSPLAGDHELTATEVAVVSSHLLRAADIAVFELAMWESWGGAADITDMRPDAVARRNTDE